MTIDSLINSLIKEKYIMSIWQVGSSTREKVYNDIDILITHSHTDNEILKKIIETRVRELFFNHKVITIDDAVRIFYNVEISIAIYSHSDLCDLLKTILKGKMIYGNVRQWAIGYWIPEALLHDLQTGKCLFHMQIQDDIKCIISKNTDILFRAIINNLMQEIEIKSKLRKKTKTNYIEKKLIERDLILAIVRIAFAIDKLMFGGYKRLEEKRQLLSDKGRQIYRMAEEILNPSNNLTNYYEKLRELVENQN